MPFDEINHGGGGGDEPSPGHDPQMLQEIASAAVLNVIANAQAHGACPHCAYTWAIVHLTQNLAMNCHTLEGLTSYLGAVTQSLNETIKARKEELTHDVPPSKLN